MASLFERRGVSDTIDSDSNGFYEKAKFVKGRRGGCDHPQTTVTCAPLHLLLSALSVGRLPAARCMMRSVRTFQALQSKVRSLLRTKAICAVAKDRMFRAHVLSPYWSVIAPYPSSAFNRGAELLLHLLYADLYAPSLKQPPLLLKSPTIERCAKARRPLG
jgi:hypothetical protein